QWSWTLLLLARLGVIVWKSEGYCSMGDQRQGCCRSIGFVGEDRRGIERLEWDRETGVGEGFKMWMWSFRSFSGVWVASPLLQGMDRGFKEEFHGVSSLVCHLLNLNFFIPFWEENPIKTPSRESHQ